MKLFVGRLPYEMTEENLRELFEKVGAVASAKVVMDRYTGRSRGFGFVEMTTQDDAKAAMDQLDGSEVMGRSIVVKEANDNDRDRDRGRSGGGRPPRG